MTRKDVSGRDEKFGDSRYGSKTTTIVLVLPSCPLWSSPMDRPYADGLSTLAAKAFELNAPEQRRNLLIHELSESIGALANHVARGDRALADELTQHVLVQAVRGKYIPIRGAFAGWARVVMWNYLVSVRRVQLIGVDRIPEPVESEALAPAHDLRIDLTIPFCRSDLAAILRWPARRRAVLLSWFLLWRKLPSENWTQTLATVSLPQGFPGEEFLELPESDRTGNLADALHVRRNAIVQTIRRGRTQLMGLRFVRELKEV
jgi:hypothetical protein